jgi:thiol-disulfide isomerase/thioredoxin
MKKCLLFGVLCIVIGFGFSQDPVLPVYKRFPITPPFKIIKVPDSTFYKKEDLKRKKATIIIIFSPDCDHCQHATQDLLANAALFKKVQIIMVSSAPYSTVKKFYFEYGIATFPNIIMGTDPRYFLGTFYQITNFPSFFVYDKKGVFVKAFEGSVPITKIAQAL